MCAVYMCGVCNILEIPWHSWGFFTAGPEASPPTELSNYYLIPARIPHRAENQRLLETSRFLRISVLDIPAKDWIPLERIPLWTPRNKGSGEPGKRLWGAQNTVWEGSGEPLGALKEHPISPFEGSPEPGWKGRILLPSIYHMEYYWDSMDSPIPGTLLLPGYTPLSDPATVACRHTRPGPYTALVHRVTEREVSGSPTYRNVIP